MRKDHRLSRALHILIHMEKISEAVTSEQIALMIKTNPVVVRRLFQGLREAGLIRSEKGHGGGWTLEKPLQEISLLQVFTAIGSNELFTVGWANEHQDCRIEQAVNQQLEQTLAAAQTMITERFAGLTLDQLVPEQWQG